MSERLRSLLAGAMLAITLAPCAAAQPQSGSVASSELQRAYRERRDSLLSWIERAERQATTTVGAARRTYSTAVTRGAVTIETAPAFVDIVSTALQRVDSLLARSPLGGSMNVPIRLRLHPHWELPDYRAGEHRTWMLDVVNSDGSETGGEWWQSVGEPPLVEQIAPALQSFERNRREKLLPPALRDWLAGSLLNIEMDDRWETVFTSLAASPTTIATACRVGNIGACRQVLLLEPTRDPLIDWFTASARRTLVQPYTESAAYVRRRLEKALPGVASSCVDGHDDAACVRLLREYAGPQAWSDPLGTSAGREALINTAIRMPGAPGLSAVMGRQELSVIATLEAISGKRLGDLLGEWIAKVQAAEPDRVQLPARRVLSAVVWVLAFGALALGGTRWRSH